MSTLNFLPRKVINGLCFVVALSTLVNLAQAAEGKRKNPTSKLFVADVEGLSSINTGEKIEDLTKKTVHTAEGTIVETNPESKSAIVLSNGSGISFDPATRLEMKKFQQEPFSPNRTDLESEPSVSQTQALLAQGTVGLCNSKMVAGSTMNYATRHADASIRAKKVVISTNDNETVISLLEGDVTVRGGSLAGGESLKPGQQAIITRRSNSEPPMIKIQPIPQEQIKGIEEKAAQACMARRTVYFDMADRKNKNTGSPEDVFNGEEPVEDELVAVAVLPGKIPTPNTVSPFEIQRSPIR